MHGIAKKSTRNLMKLTVLVSQILLISTTSNALAQSDDKVFEKWPLAFVCERESTKIVAYLSVIKENGSAIYTGSGGKRALTVSADGIILVTNDPQSGCNGKSLEDLENLGLTLKAE